MAPTTNPPEVYCRVCYVVQPYTGQKNCTNPNCGVRFSDWHIATQLTKSRPQPVSARN